MNYQYEQIKCLQFLDIYKKKTQLKKMIINVKIDLLKFIFWCAIFIFHMIRIFELNKLILSVLICVIVVIIRVYLGFKTSKIKKQTNNISFLNREQEIIYENINNLNELKLVKNLLKTNKNSREGEYIIIILSSIICFFIGFNLDYNVYELLIKNIIEILLLCVSIIIFIPAIKYLFNNNENEIKQLLIKNINLIEYEKNKELNR